MFRIVFVIAFILLVVYCLVILLYRRWYLRLPVFELTHEINSRQKFSVIIPARNEEANIRACLISVMEQTYPAEMFEVIVINDHSTDQTENIIRSLQQQYSNLKLLNLKDLLPATQLNSYKKKAIELAIGHADGDWIVTTDADCMVNKEWLMLLNNYIALRQPVFIAAPVTFRYHPSFLSIFQLLDFMSLQGITAAAVSAGYHTMCNGANIAYRKDVFYEVGQFAGIDHLASGDDMLLMYKIKQKYPDQLGYLYHPRSIVVTEPMQDWKSFLNQRIRWASKADQYQDKSIFQVLFLVYAVNALLFILFFWSLFTKWGWMYWLFLLLVKTGVELTLMIPVAAFFKQSDTLWWFPVLQPFHITYTVIAGWLGKFGTYQWKGRNVK